jgi:hypothetical protein
MVIVEKKERKGKDAPKGTPNPSFVVPKIPVMTRAKKGLGIWEFSKTTDQHT